MWTLSKSFRFEAAHHLPSHDGKCARVHGHSWVCTVEAQGGYLHTTGPKVGMVLDYGDLTLAILPIWTSKLDHHDLNQTTGLANPTSEELARYLFDLLVEEIPGLIAVTIRETCSVECRYVRR